MNPNFRLAALIAAALGLVVSLFIALSPGDDDATPATTAPPATTGPETLPTEPETETETEPPPATTTNQVTTAVPDVVTIRLVVRADEAPEVRHLSVARDRKVKVVVRSAFADHVHVHGYDLMADVAPGAPATIEFTATAPGRFEIELEERRLQLAELEVRP